MNQTQVKYARTRAQRIFESRKQALAVKHTTPAIRLSTEAKLAALKAGAFRIDATHDERRYGWSHCVIFTAERGEEIDKAALEAETAELTETYRKHEDELVLGDNEAALALLRAFEAADAA
ncbi:hypothetical protein [Sphingomonas desiccabilis]|uniref:Uncharacterized protein n=1 Tax=Sphingomonas desiccabilis TaxID=429134 RepID=A0A4Q2IZY9_9SPHN|nr:hypothetical protein [Sphingomonas desiccabilis]MBB3910129.1 hypothetical protein [Sphingomonas desiccabilis]RXZ34814.1 hypothetical protein EO081_03915 [Sphingomonas desiccabilis]